MFINRYIYGENIIWIKKVSKYKCNKSIIKTRIKTHKKMYTVLYYIMFYIYYTNVFSVFINNEIKPNTI